MIKISEKELIKHYIKRKCCVIVYPNTDWMENIGEGEEYKDKAKFICNRLHLNDIYDIVENKFFIYIFTGERLENGKSMEEFDNLESCKFFKEFKEQHEEDDMFYVQLFVNGKFAGENT